MLVRVKNLLTQEEGYYTCSPREAVVCAYAQHEFHDFNTWDYFEKYDHLVEEGRWTYMLGNWTVLKGNKYVRE